VGQGNKFELWDAETWGRNREQWLSEVDLDNMELPADLESLSI